MKPMPSQRTLLARAPSRDEATILFLDIRGFSHMFDEHDPMEVLHFANSVLSELGMVVEACWCAVRIRESVAKLNLQRYFADQPVVAVGIGIHTGVFASGVISTSVKSEFTVLGDVVNLAARIENLTKEFLVDCLVSQAVYEACKERLQFQKMPLRALKGVKSNQSTYWLLPTNRFL